MSTPESLAQTAALLDTIEPEELVGQIIDRRYQLTRPLGRGAFGCVFEAAEQSLGQYVSRVAVKLIAPRNQSEREAVRREVRGLGQLSHDHIIIYRTSGEIDEGPWRGLIFLVTELAETSLERLLSTPEGIDDDQLRRMALGIAQALAHCHRLGAVHRDVKPANIFRVQGRWKLADFGLVRSQDELQAAVAMREGSYAYMAPETLEGTTTAKSDVYSLGATILEALTGHWAHDGSTVDEFCANLRRLPARIPDNLPPLWQSVLTRCLAADPQQRCSAEELAAQLGDGPPHPPTQLHAPPSHLAPGDTIVVSKLGRGHCLTVADALKLAQPGARILVRPGHYKEALQLDKPITLIGDGPAQEIVLQATDDHPALYCTAADVALQGVTIACKSSIAPRYAVEIAGGSARIGHCRIESGSLACVAIYAPSTRVVLEGCRVHGSADTGIWVFDEAHAVLDDCQLYNNTRAGATVGQGAIAVLRRCRIHHGQASGIYVYQGGRIELEDCELANNRKAGVAVGSAGFARICRCVLRTNGAYGVWAETGSQGEVQQCTFEANLGQPYFFAAGSHMTAS